MNDNVGDVKARLDIVEMVGAYVPLARSGGAFKARCPFHEERTPSFFVFPDRQYWRCFGQCGEGGDVINFYMKMERMDFAAALRALADRVGIKLSAPKMGSKSRDTLYEINECAGEYYRRALASERCEHAQQYVEGRGLTPEIVSEFGIGYAPPGNGILEWLRRNGHDVQRAREVGLAGQGDDGSFYPFFRDRLMFPIRDASGRLAGFGGRALSPDVSAKYVNTRSTPIFDKQRLLYGMDRARESVRQQGAVVVEGYMDAVTAHQYGFHNVVAAMGTSLTEAQVSEIRKTCRTVTLALDGDPAGQEATLRSLESSWAVFQNMSVRAAGNNVRDRDHDLELLVLELPTGQDPDGLIRADSDGWLKRLERAVPVFEYLLQTLTSRFDLGNDADRIHVARSMLRFVALTPDRMQRELHLEKIAAGTRMSLQNLSRELSAMRDTAERPWQHGRAPQDARRRANGTAMTAMPPEDLYLGFALTDTDQIMDNASLVKPEWFTNNMNRMLWSALMEGGSVDDEDLQARVSELVSNPALNAYGHYGRRVQAYDEIRRHMELDHQRSIYNDAGAAMLSLDPESADSERAPLERTMENAKARILELEQSYG